MLRDTPTAADLAHAPPREVFAAIAAALDARIIGQQALTQRLLIALLCDGHVLVEGVPGLAKTTAVKTLAELLEADFHRIQFTPDLLPADLTGTEVFRAETGTFEFRPGPVFRSLVLADEINRAPAKAWCVRGWGAWDILALLTRRARKLQHVACCASRPCTRTSAPRPRAWTCASP